MSASVDSPIGFADAVLEEYRRDASSLVVQVRSWNDRRLIVTFSDVIALRDRLAGEFSDLVGGANESNDLLQEAIAQAYETAPPSLTYQVFSFLNHDDQPSLEIVAATCHVKVGLSKLES